MAKKKMGKMAGIHIHPKAGTHYEVRHDPHHESRDMPTMGDDEENTKLFSHGERDKMHEHIDNLMDAHEGKAQDMEGGEDTATALPPKHPLHMLKRKAM